MSNNDNITLDSLKHFWLPNGAPCFLADDLDICNSIESLGFQIYYLIGYKGTTVNNTTTYKPGSPSVTTQSTTYKSKLFKVVNNFVGRAISESEEDFGEGIVALDEEAQYTMPALPNVIIKKLDEFFRLIFAQHGTESIVLLTYDTEKTGSDGWGILVPEQTNTPAHCSYDPDSVVELKGDSILIVGSVHSHPEMPAYASGTDHSDQADFDGVHITYGWQKSVSNGATQYHLELQMAGTSYKLNIEDVFEDIATTKEPDPEVVAWSEKVKKVLPPQHQLAGVTGFNHTTTPQVWDTHITTTDTIVPEFTVGGRRKPSKRDMVIPFDTKTYNGVIAAEIDISGNGNMICPSCLLALFKTEIYRGSSCPACDIPIVAMNDDLNNIVDSLDVYQMERNLSTFIPYYLWATDSMDEKDFIMMLKPADPRTPSDGTLNSQDDAYPIQHFNLPDDDDDSYVYNHLMEECDPWEFQTLCCGAPLEGPATACTCRITVLPTDTVDFEEVLTAQNIDLYEKDSICDSCANYYLPSCPKYRQQVVLFVVDGQLPTAKMNGCPDWQAYKTSEYLKNDIWENYGV